MMFHSVVQSMFVCVCLLFFVVVVVVVFVLFCFVLTFYSLHNSNLIIYHPLTLQVFVGLLFILIATSGRRKKAYRKNNINLFS